MKVFAVMSIARQINGEYVVVRAEKAFLKASEADDFSKGLSKQFKENITTPMGIVECICERGVFEFEVQE